MGAESVDMAKGAERMPTVKLAIVINAMPTNRNDKPTAFSASKCVGEIPATTLVEYLTMVETTAAINTVARTTLNGATNANHTKANTRMKANT